MHWHRRLHHPHVPNVREILRTKGFDVIDPENVEDDISEWCESRIMGKMTWAQIRIERIREERISFEVGLSSDPLRSDPLDVDAFEHNVEKKMFLFWLEYSILFERGNMMDDA